MTDFTEIMNQARQMQEQMKKAQEELASKIVSGQSGAGLVTVSMNGRHDVLGVQIDASLMSEDKAVVEDLIAAAVNDAVRKVEEHNKSSLGNMADGLNLPEGFKFPF
ncbi:MAG: DNA-binding YbaB/EbfC family protein [Pseudohongiellaceae bacterium]|jgi:DNA-binding YbaB/EbfC family protein